MKATKAAVKIKGAVLEAAMSLFTPNLNQTGSKIKAPPMARVAPNKPAKNAAIM